MVVGPFSGDTEKRWWTNRGGWPAADEVVHTSAIGLSGPGAIPHCSGFYGLRGMSSCRQGRLDTRAARMCGGPRSIDTGPAYWGAAAPMRTAVIFPVYPAAKTLQVSLQAYTKQWQRACNDQNLKRGGGKCVNF